MISCVLAAQELNIKNVVENKMNKISEDITRKDIQYIIESINSSLDVELHNSSVFNFIRNYRIKGMKENLNELVKKYESLLSESHKSDQMKLAYQAGYNQGVLSNNVTLITPRWETPQDAEYDNAKELRENFWKVINKDFEERFKEFVYLSSIDTRMRKY